MRPRPALATSGVAARPILLFMPQTAFEWFLEPLPPRCRQGQLPGRVLLVMRFVGLSLMMWAFYRLPSMPPECRPFYRLILAP